MNALNLPRWTFAPFSAFLAALTTIFAKLGVEKGQHQLSDSHPHGRDLGHCLGHCLVHWRNPWPTEYLTPDLVGVDPLRNRHRAFLVVLLSGFTPKHGGTIFPDPLRGLWRAA